MLCGNADSILVLCMPLSSKKFFFITTHKKFLVNLLLRPVEVHSFSVGRKICGQTHRLSPSLLKPRDTSSTSSWQILGCQLLAILVLHH